MRYVNYLDPPPTDESFRWSQSDYSSPHARLVGRYPSLQKILEQTTISG